MIKKGTLMAQVSDIASAITLPMILKKSIKVNEINVNEKVDGVNFDLEHLNAEEREIVV